MESQVIENKINKNNLSEIVKIRNGKLIVVALLIIVLGVISVCIPFFIETHSEFISGAFVFFGVVLIAIGLLLAFLKNKQHVYSKTGSPVKSNIYYIQRERIEDVKMILTHAAFALAKPINFQESGNVRIEVLQSFDNYFVAAQVFEYVPFAFRAATQLYCYTEVQANDFIAFLEKCKKR